MPRRIQRRWVVLGATLLIFIIVCSLFPHLLTPFRPTQVEYADYNTGLPAPFAPSFLHPFGTDSIGRDFIALTLSATFNTLIPATVITAFVLAVSLVVAVVATTSEQTWLSSIVQWVGHVMSSLPVLFILILAMDRRNMASPYQEIQYVIWVSIFEIGRGAYAFSQSISGWFQMDFVEGAKGIGRAKLGILFTHLRSWLGQFSMEFAFSEFVRVLSIMTMLAAVHIYPVEKLSDIPFFISYPPILGIQSAQISWVSLIGDSTNNFAFVSYPYFLYGPVLAIFITVMGANFIARGLRGTLEPKKNLIPAALFKTIALKKDSSSVEL